MCYDAVPMQKVCRDVRHLLPQITSYKLSKSLLDECRMESLMYVYMLAIYTLQMLIVINHLKCYNNCVFSIICLKLTFSNSNIVTM